MRYSKKGALKRRKSLTAIEREAKTECKRVRYGEGEGEIGREVRRERGGEGRRERGREGRRERGREK